MKKLIMITVVLAIVYTVLPDETKRMVQWYVSGAYDYVRDYASWFLYKHV